MDKLKQEDLASVPVQTPPPGSASSVSVVLPFRSDPQDQLELFLVRRERAYAGSMVYEALSERIELGEGADSAVLAAERALAAEGLSGRHWLTMGCFLLDPATTDAHVVVYATWGKELMDAPGNGRWVSLPHALDSVDYGLVWDHKTVTALLMAQQHRDSLRRQLVTLRNTLRARDDLG